MRSRARAVSRRAVALAAAFAFVALMGLASAGSAAADDGHVLAVETRSVALTTALGGTVGVTAVVLGLGGMVAGAVRRRKGAAVADPANERED
ncbi:hypothetical protein GCM10012275_33180 [Longimycelium tulufanense]|uniref:Uncharacterized protein n=1 Tax=Longimycelium tulufanense TaxID=907463 RepID=A0A8J3CFU7_9PSEU|nr:hypothetical protein [Longimycelium tulufanense]GGM59375.1 hypothetical protein GCM10012275_33180 [Longimycelium tulufanense]